MGVEGREVDGRGGKGGGWAWREKRDVRGGKGGGNAGRENFSGRGGMTGEGDAGIQNTWGRGGKRGGLADCIVGGYMVTVGCDEKDGHSMNAGLWAYDTGDD